MNIKMQIDKQIIPLTKKEVIRWCKYYYDTTPVVQDYVDYLCQGKLTADMLVHFIQPSLKFLVFAEKLNQLKMKKADRKRKNNGSI